MKIIHKLLIKSFLKLFIVIFFTMIFIFLLQNLWKYIDDLIGKGLDLSIIFEICIYILPTLIPIAVPISILLASIMTFGYFGETYQIIAMKSAGISLEKIIYPLLLVVFSISLIVFFCTNSLIPYSNLKFKTLLYDIMNKKLELNIKEGIFFNSIDGYSIKIDEKKNNGEYLKNILIYNYKKNIKNIKTITASHGKMYNFNDKYLFFELYKGFTYQENTDSNIKKKNINTFSKSSFNKQIIKFDLSSFQLNRSDKEKYSNIAQFMNLSQLSARKDSLKNVINSKKHNFKNEFLNMFNLKSLNNDSIDKFKLNFIVNEKIERTCENLIKSTKSYIYNNSREISFKQKQLRKGKIETHKKFTISISCIIMLLVGVPIGSIIRKGGIGLPVIYATLFYLAFHVLSITFEKLSLQGVIDPQIGMWLPIIIFIPLIIKLFKIYKNNIETVKTNYFTDIFKIFNSTWIKKIF